MPSVAHKVADLPPTIKSSDVPPGSSPFSDTPNWSDVAPDLPASKAETELILKALTGTYNTVGMALMLVAPMDAVRFAANIDEMVESWRQLLDNDNKFRKKMLKMVQASGWGAVVAAHLPVALAIAGNHRDSFSHLFKSKSSTTNDEG